MVESHQDGRRPCRRDVAQLALHPKGIMDWWFKLAMMILIPIVLLELIALFVRLPRFRRKGERND